MHAPNNSHTLVQLIANDNDATQFYTAWVTHHENVATDGSI